MMAQTTWEKKNFEEIIDGIFDQYDFPSDIDPMKNL